MEFTILADDVFVDAEPDNEKQLDAASTASRISVSGTHMSTDVNQTMLLTGAGGDMEMTACVTQNISLYNTAICSDQIGDKDESFVKVDSKSFLTRLTGNSSTYNLATRKANCTSIQSNAENTGGIHFTQCHTAAIKTTSIEEKLDTAAALSRIMPVSNKQNVKENIGNLTVANHPQMFSDDGNTGHMDFTQCHTAAIGSTPINQELDATATLSRKMAAPKGNKIENHNLTAANHTQMFSEDGNLGGMDFTQCHTASIETLPVPEKLDAMCALSRIMSVSKQNREEHIGNLTVANHTQMFSDDGNTGHMDFTQCHTAAIESTPINQELDATATQSRKMAAPKGNKIENHNLTAANHTQMFSEDGNPGGMDFTQYHTASKETLPVPEKLDAMSALSRIMSVSKQNREEHIGNLTVANHTQMFSDDGNTGRMDFTQCHTATIESTPINQELDATATLSRKMAAPKGNKIENHNLTAANHTQMFSEDGSPGGMDFTQCHTASIETFPVPEKLDATSALSRIMSVSKQNREERIGNLTVANHTQMFSDDGNTGRMDFTQCHTATIESTPINQELDATATLSRKMAAPKGNKIEHHNLTTANHTQMFSDDGNPGGMDFTQCHTASIETFPVPEKLDATSALSRIMSVSKQNREQNIGNLTVANHTQMFPDDGNTGDMDFTQCHTVAIESTPINQELDATAALSRIMAAPKETKKEIHTLTTANHTQMFSENGNPGGMDFTQCHTVAIETVPIKDKLDAASALSRIMSVPKQNGKENSGNLTVADCTQMFSEDENPGGMDFTRCHTAAIETVPMQDKLDTASALSRIMSVPKQNRKENSGNLTVANCTRMFSEDGNTGCMDFTQCQTAAIETGPIKEKLDSIAALSKIMSAPKENNKENITLSAAKHTQMFSDDGNGAGMDVTQCHTTAIEPAPIEVKLDAAGALFRIMSAPKEGKKENISTWTAANHTQMFSEDGNPGGMDFTQCHTAAIETVPMQDKLDTASALSRIMSVPKQKRKENIGNLTVANCTRMFSEDGNTGCMDSTQCQTAAIESGPIKEKLDSIAALSRIMSAPKENNKENITLSAAKHTQMFSDDGNGAGMDVTHCHTTAIEPAPIEVKLDAAGALFRIMSAPKQGKKENISTWAAANHTQMFSEDGIPGGMDFTQCHTTAIETVPMQDKLDTASALSRIMSVSKQNKKENIGNLTVANCTQMFSDDGTTGGMDFTQSHTVAIESTLINQELDDTATLSRIMAAPKETKKETHTLTTANYTQIFSDDENPGSMDFTQCQTAAIETGPIKEKLDSIAALSRIMSAPKENNKENIIALSEANRTQMFSEDGNSADMDVTQYHTTAIEPAPIEVKLDTAGALFRIMSAPKEDKKEKIGTWTAANRIQMFSEDGIPGGMDFTQCHTTAIETVPMQDKLDTTSGLSKIMSVPKQKRKENIGNLTVANCTRMFSEDGNTGCMDFTQCQTAAIETGPIKEKLDSIAVLSRIMSAPKENNIENIIPFSAANRTQMFSEDGNGAGMDVNQCHSTTIEPAPIEGKLDAAGARFRIMSASKEGKKENISTTAAGNHTQMFSENENPGGMDFTQCYTAEIETVAIQNKLDTASALSRIMFVPKQNSKENHGNLTVVNCTRMFSKDGNTDHMEFTKCLTQNITQNSLLSLPHVTSKSILEQSHACEDGCDMEFTSLSKIQVQEFKDGNDDGAKSIKIAKLRNKDYQSQVIDECNKESPVLTEIPIKVSDYMVSSGIPVSHVPEKIQAKNTDFDHTMVYTEQIEMNKDDQTQIIDECNKGSTVLTDVPIKISDYMVSSGIPVSHVPEKSQAKNTDFDHTMVYAEHIKMTKCVAGPQPFVHDNVAAVDDKNKTIDRTRLDSQGSDDMEFTGQITDVVLSGVAADQQQKENSSMRKPTKRSVGLSVRSTGSATSTTLKIPDVQPARAGLTEITHHYSPIEPSVNVHLTSCPERAVFSSTSSVSESDSETDMLRPDDGVPIRLGPIAAPRITKDGCIYTQGTFDSNLKFIGEFEEMSPLKASIETSQRANSAIPLVQDSPAMSCESDSGVLAIASQSEPGNTKDIRQKPNGTYTENQTQDKTNEILSTKQHPSLNTDNTFRMDLIPSVENMSERTTNIIPVFTGKESSENQSIQNLPNKIRHLQDEGDTGAIEMTTSTRPILNQTNQLQSSEPQTMGIDALNNSDGTFPQTSRPKMSCPLIIKDMDVVHTSTKHSGQNRTSMEAIPITAVDVVADIPHKNGGKTLPQAHPSVIRETTQTGCVEEVLRNKTKIFYGNKTSAMEMTGCDGQIFNQTEQLASVKEVTKGHAENELTTYDDKVLKIPGQFSSSEISECLLTTKPLQDSKHNSTAEKSIMPAHMPSASLVDNDMDLSLETDIAGQRSLMIVQDTMATTSLQSLKHSKSVAEKSTMSAYTPSSTMVDMDLSMECGVTEQQSLRIMPDTMSLTQPPQGLKHSNSAAEEKSISPTLEAMDLSLDADFPSTEDLMPLSFQNSMSRKRDKCQDLEITNEQYTEVSQSPASKVQKHTENTDDTVQSENISKSDLNASRELFKRVSKRHAPIMMPPTGEHLTYSVPLLGMSCSQLSLMDISSLNNCQPQTIDDYLQMFNIRMISARRNSTNIKAIQMEEPTDNASRLKQTFIDAPQLELLEASTHKLGERKTNVAQALNKLETDLMTKPPAIFIDIQKASAEQVANMRQKYKDMYKACSINTKVALKTVKCDFIQQVNMKYLEQIPIVEKIKGELLDKIEFSTEVLQLIDEVINETKQDMDTLKLEGDGTPEQRLQLSMMDQKIKDAELLCASKEAAIKNIERQIMMASKMQHVVQGQLSEQLVALFPPCYLAKHDAHLRNIQSLCLWHTVQSTQNAHTAAFLFNSLILKSKFEHDEESSTDCEDIKDLVFTSKLNEKSAGYAKISHLFALSAVDVEKLQSKHRTKDNYAAVLRDVAVQVAIAADLAESVRDTSVWNNVKINGLVISIQFSSLPAFAKFVLTVTIDPKTYPMQQPLWDFKSTIGTTRRVDIERVFQYVKPGLGYLFRMVSAVNKYLQMNSIDPLAH